MISHAEAEPFLPDLAFPQDSAEEISEDILRHIESCQECRDWLETYSSLRLVLEPAALDEHVSAETLAEGAAGGALDRVSEEHLGTCRACRNEFELACQGLLHVGTDVDGEVVRPGVESAGIDSFWPKALVAAAAVAVAVGVPLWQARSRQLVLPDYVISQRSLLGVEVFDAGTSIRVSDTEVSAGADVTLRAGQIVALENGFRVETDGSLRIEIREE